MRMPNDTMLSGEEMLARARAVIPNGVSSGGRALFAEVIVRAEGSYV